MLLAYNFNKSNSGNKWYQIAQRFTKTKLMQIIDYSSNLRLRGKSWLLQKTFIVLVFGGKKAFAKEEINSTLSIFYHIEPKNFIKTS